MYARIYRYKVKKERKARWLELIQKADDIYARFPEEKRWTAFVREEKDFLAAVEFSLYSSEDDYKQIAASLEEEPALQKIFAEFKEILFEPTVAVDGYDVVKDREQK